MVASEIAMDALCLSPMACSGIVHSSVVETKRPPSPHSNVAVDVRRISTVAPRLMLAGTHRHGGEAYRHRRCRARDNSFVWACIYCLGVETKCGTKHLHWDLKVSYIYKD
jgi:hypothetical protein